MKKFNKFALLGSLALLSSSILTLVTISNSQSKRYAPVFAVGEKGSVSINVVNCADYIYIQDIEEGYEAEDLVVQFEKYAETSDDSPFKGWDVTVNYSTSDTPETMYNEVKTGKTRIDLVCPSDYMIQKMLGEGILDPIDRDLVPNYKNYCSPTISAYLDNIEATNSKGEKLRLEDYCVGYMWGTLGLLFNPTFERYKMDIEGADEMNEEELAEAEFEHIVTDMRHYKALWNSEYDGTVSIKNSIRDTLAVVDMKHHEDILLGYREEYVNGDITAEEYNAKINNIFNLYSKPANSDAEFKFDNETRDAIYQELLSLKRNIFGLEVDSGKNDIVTGKIGINLAWSGDAVYAMEQAADEGIELLYSIPEEGANVWFDGWVMPHFNRSEEQRLLAHMFLDFLSNPENAAQNMDYIGYTSFIAGDDILSLVRDWYDVRTELMTFYVDDEDEEGQPILVNDGGEYRELDYPDFVSTSHDNALDNEPLVYGDEHTSIDQTYGELTIVDAPDSEYFAVDLTYFFKETLSDEYEDEDMVFYAEDYYVDVDDKHPEGLAVGADFYCQYPDEETITRCCIMQDFGENNKRILELWEDFKSGEFPAWAIILLTIEIAAAAGVATYLLLKKKISKDHRKKRKLASQNN